MAQITPANTASRCWRTVRHGLQRWRDDRGATGLEFCLLLAAVVLPSVAIIRLALKVLAEHYEMLVTLNALPMP